MGDHRISNRSVLHMSSSQTPIKEGCIRIMEGLCHRATRLSMRSAALAPYVGTPSNLLLNRVQRAQSSLIKLSTSNHNREPNVMH